MPTDDGWIAALLGEARRLRDAAAAREPTLGGRPPAEIVALGLATVDTDRAIAHLGGTDWAPLPRDSLLGASVRRRPPEPADGLPAILLLEPDAEGYLAASLARFGEGLAAVYLRPGRTRRTTAARIAAGPLGPAWLLPGPRWGPHLVVLEPRATIGR